MFLPFLSAPLTTKQVAAEQFCRIILLCTVKICSSNCEARVIKTQREKIGFNLKV